MISKNLQKYIRQLEQKKYRKREGLFVAEGTKNVGDLLKRFTPKTVFATGQWLAPEGVVPQIISEEELQRISFQQHPQQVLALFPIPQQDNVDPIKLLNDQTLVIALDGVQDPGNLGTIIRIADWFGIDAVFASGDTVDIFNPKVVQASMGAIFRVKFHYCDIVSLCSRFSLEGVAIPSFSGPEYRMTRVVPPIEAGRIRSSEALSSCSKSTFAIS